MCSEEVYLIDMSSITNSVVIDVLRYIEYEEEVDLNQLYSGGEGGREGRELLPPQEYTHVAAYGCGLKSV